MHRVFESLDMLSFFMLSLFIASLFIESFFMASSAWAESVPTARPVATRAAPKILELDFMSLPFVGCAGQVRGACGAHGRDNRLAETRAM